MKIGLEVAIITGIILLGIVVGFYVAITIPWEDYFNCIMIGGHIPTGLRADYSCIEII